VASADNRGKWLHAFIRQIFFRKECARMDSRARSPEGTAQYRLELSEQLFPGFRTLVTKLDAIEGSQLLRACKKSLPSPGRVGSRNDMKQGDDVGLARIIADEMREEHQRHVLGE
jgi:hypothetical protein